MRNRGSVVIVENDKVGLIQRIRDSSVLNQKKRQPFVKLQTYCYNGRARAQYVLEIAL